MFYLKNFFKSRDFWQSQGMAGLFGTAHIIAIFAVILITAVLCVIFRKTSPQKVKMFLMVSGFVWAALEVLKLTLSISQLGFKSAAFETLPFFTCSLLLYCLFFSAFGKGVVKQISDYCIVTVCLFSGLAVVFYTIGLINYPFFSFYGLHSFLYHAYMFFTGVFLLATGYVKPRIKKFYLAYIPIPILAVPAVIANSLLKGSDYMLMNYADFVPVAETIAQTVPKPVFVIFMLILYVAYVFVLTALSALFCVLAAKLSRLKKCEKHKENNPAS